MPDAGQRREQSPAAPAPVVHPTAIVHASAHLEEGTRIGPYAVIGAGCVIGARTVVGPHSVVHDNVHLGHNNHLEAHVVIGGRPQDRSYRGEPTRTLIGDDNIFSAFASVDRATGEGLETRMGNGAYVMSYAKVSHNCVIGDAATIVSGALLGGWVHIGDHAYIGGVTGVHQFVHVGRLAIVAGLSAVRQDVPPYLMVAGWRGTARGLNRVGLQRHGVPLADRLALRRAFRIFYQSELSMDAALEQLEAEARQSVHVLHFLDFIRAARGRTRGIVGWKNETEL